LLENVPGLKWVFDTANPIFNDDRSKPKPWPKQDPGDGAVREIIKDLLASGYDAGFSIEPHLAVVFHDTSVTASEDTQYNTYVEYGRRLEKLIKVIQSEITPKKPIRPHSVPVSGLRG
jgi:hypothetical protein